MSSLITADAAAAFLKVMAIDLVLAGDNAIVIGLAAAGLPAERRARVILVGVVVATVLRLAFAAVALQLLAIVGLLLAGGILLLWVCWKMWRELRGLRAHAAEMALASGETQAAPKTFAQAAWQIVLADVSMSLDNVLAVAGAARDHPTVLIIGLVLSVALMGLASTFVARLIGRYRWIAYLGVALILFVAVRMMYEGYHEMQNPHVAGEPEAATATE